MSSTNRDESASTNSKPGAYNVRASSMSSLLSEVSKYSDSHRRGTISKASGSSSHSASDASLTRRKIAGKCKLSKTDAIFSKSNRGLEARSARDRSHMLSREDLSTEARRVLEAREKMEKKAALYEKLAKGENVKGVSRDQLREGLLVDFETKAVEESYNDRTRSKNRRKDKGKGRQTDSDSDSSYDGRSDEDESRTVPKPPAVEDDEVDGNELVETTDELGRTRWVRRSQLPKPRQPSEEPRQSVLEGGRPIFSEDISLASSSNLYAPMGEHAETDRHTYYGDQTYFHVYQPSAEEIAARRKNLNLDAPLAVHFDSKKEIRNRGAGFMQFSKDEEERQRQMEQLRQERTHTEAERAKNEALGDASKRREAELEARRKLVEEKRRQVLEKRKAAEAEREQARGSKTAKIGSSS